MIQKSAGIERNETIKIEIQSHKIFMRIERKRVPESDWRERKGTSKV
jgi:hypothetical protein